MLSAGHTARMAKKKTTSRKKAAATPWWKRRKVWLWSAGPLAVLGFFAVLALFVFVQNVPLPSDIAPSSTAVFDAQGELIGDLTSDTTRVDVEIEDLPPHVTRAVLAAEDRGYYEHGGISLFGMARALVTNLRAGEIEQGGSTITQQYVKNAVVGSERTYTRKLREVALAVKLDRNYSKDQILEWYLNSIYWGRGAYGIEAAARTYFDVGATQLSVSQAATLAGMIQAPEGIDPAEDPDRADGRRQFVLDGMLGEEWLSQAEYDAAVGEGLPTVTTSSALTASRAPYYLDAVRRQLAEELGDDAVARGLQVFTAMDPRAQARAEELIRGIEDPELTGALVALDPTTGHVVALVGGRGFQEDNYNAAVRAERQIGSTFKAFTNAAFFEAGFSPESRFAAPGQIAVDDKEDGFVRNYDGRDRGTITVYQATQASVNTVYVQLQDEVGPESVVDMAVRAGLPEERRGENVFSRGSTMTLGVDEFTPIELAEAYGTFADGGVHHDASVITRVEKDGEVLWESDVDGTVVMDANDAFMTTETLRRVVEAGTGGAADIGRPLAGKTGTTDGGADGWFAGYTPELLATVWVGRRDSNEPVEGLTGGGVPAQIFHDFMSVVLEGVEPTDFPSPDLSEYEILNERGDDCPGGFSAMPEGAEIPTDDPEPAPTGSDGEEAPRVTRTEYEVSPSGTPCMRVVAPEPEPSDSESETETESESETESETPSPLDTVLPDDDTEEPSDEPTRSPSPSSSPSPSRSPSASPSPSSSPSPSPTATSPSPSPSPSETSTGDEGRDAAPSPSPDDSET